MKKTIMFVIASLMIYVLTACTKPAMYSMSFFDYMYTYISVNLVADSEEDATTYKNEIEAIYAMYHTLSTNFDPLNEDAPYLENIYTINQTTGQTLEIDFQLYEMILVAEEIKAITDGYFDISIGKIVDVWKNNITDEEDGYLFEEVPVEVFNAVLTQLESIAVIETPFELSESDGKYYIRILHPDVKIDLGAFAKGFATQKVYDYLVAQDLVYFSISAGSSSISLAKNYNRDTRLFHVTLANPVRTGGDDRTYGMIKVMDTHITTSGNYEQYALYEGLRYHHIISPMTKRPMQYYHTVTLAGNNAGAIDAISTALFNMPETVFDAWLETYQESYELEVVRFNYDGTISTFLSDIEFEANP